MKSKPLQLKDFCLIFEYGSENSGFLMYTRFVNQFNRDIEAFKDSLCQIDRDKLERYTSGKKKA